MGRTPHHRVALIQPAPAARAAVIKQVADDRSDLAGGVDDGAARCPGVDGEAFAGEEQQGGEGPTRKNSPALSSPMMSGKFPFGAWSMVKEGECAQDPADPDRVAAPDPVTEPGGFAYRRMLRVVKGCPPLAFG